MNNQGAAASATAPGYPLLSDEQLAALLRNNSFDPIPTQPTYTHGVDMASYANDLLSSYSGGQTIAPQRTSRGEFALTASGAGAPQLSGLLDRQLTCRLVVFQTASPGPVVQRSSTRFTGATSPPLAEEVRVDPQAEGGCSRDRTLGQLSRTTATEGT